MGELLGEKAKCERLGVGVDEADRVDEGENISMLLGETDGEKAGVLEGVKDTDGDLDGLIDFELLIVAVVVVEGVEDGFPE